MEKYGSGGIWDGKKADPGFGINIPDLQYISVYQTLQRSCHTNIALLLGHNGWIRIWHPPVCSREKNC
jgi:hypothetical protein